MPESLLLTGTPSQSMIERDTPTTFRIATQGPHLNRSGNPHRQARFSTESSAPEIAMVSLGLTYCRYTL
jgi:hypothetical protein